VDGLGFRRVVHNAVSAQVTGALGGLEANLMLAFISLCFTIPVLVKEKRLAAPR